MTAKGAFWAMAVLLCLASVSGRKLLDVQVTAPGTNVQVQDSSPPSSPSSPPANSTSPSTSPAPCTPVSVTAPYTSVQVPCTPSPPAQSPSSPPSPPATTTATVTATPVNVQVPGYASVNVGRKL